MGGVRECGRADAAARRRAWVRRGRVSCHGFAVWIARGKLRTTLQTLTLAPGPAWDHLETTCAPCSRDCTGGYRDLDDLFGLVGGPAAARLPLPALADVRTVTWPVGW